MFILDYLKKLNYKDIFLSLLSLIVLFLVAKFMLKGYGYSDKFIPFLILFIMFFGSFKIGFWFVVFPICLIYFIYTPIGMLVGRLDVSYLLSFFATDSTEFFEFFKIIPL